MIIPVTTGDIVIASATMERVNGITAIKTVISIFAKEAVTPRAADDYIITTATMNDVIPRHTADPFIRYRCIIAERATLSIGIECKLSDGRIPGIPEPHIRDVDLKATFKDEGLDPALSVSMKKATRARVFVIEEVNRTINPDMVSEL